MVHFWIALDKNISYSKNKDAIEAIIYEFIENYMFEEEKLQLLLTQNNLNLEYYKVQDKLIEIRNKIDFSFQANLVKCTNEMYSLLTENKDSITNILSIDNFYSNISLINEHIEIEDDFEYNIIKKYIEEKPSRTGFYLKTYKSFIAKYYPSLLEYLNEKDTLKLMKNLESTEIISLFQKVHSGWNPNDCFILNNIDPIIYKNYIIEYPNFFEELIDFIQVRYFTDEFSEAIKKIKTILMELHNQNEDYAWRIERLFNDGKISWEEFVKDRDVEKNELEE